MSTVDLAHDYVRRGWAVVPLYGWDGSRCRCHLGLSCPAKSAGKHPSLGNAWQERALTSGADVQAWWDEHPDDNTGIATGTGTGLWVLDIDGADGVRTITALAAEHGALPQTRIIRTGSGGLHYYFRHPGNFTVHNSTSWLGPGVDVRGKGGQVVAPPSVSGRGAYTVIADHPVTDAPDWLLELVAEHAANAEAGRSAAVRGAEPVDVEFMPPRIRELASTIVGVDEGRHKHFHSLVAACYEASYTQGQTVTVAAPWCAVVDKFVGRVESEVARSWGKLEAEAQRANDWIDGIAGPGGTALAAQPVPVVIAAEDEAAAAVDDLEPTWRPVDLTAILDGTWEPERPALMPRTDGAHLLYAGRVHSFHGESESGKSLVVQAESARTLNAGGSVLYVDFESDAAAVTGRLLELGTSRSALATRFWYVRPDADPRVIAAEREAFAELLRSEYTLAVVDGVTDALGIFGASTKDNDEVGAFMRLVPRLIARRTGAAVVVIDHVSKSADTRGRFAIGGQQKMAALDGAAYVVDVAEPLGRGLCGAVVLRIAKDRPGGVRPESGPFRKLDRTQEAARIVVDSTGKGIVVEVVPPHHLVTDSDVKSGRWRPTNIMERVSRLLEVAPEALSGTAIVSAVQGKEKHIKAAVTELVAEGFVRADAGPRRAVLHVSLRPYREAEDPESDAFEGWMDGLDDDSRPLPPHSRPTPARMESATPAQDPSLPTGDGLESAVGEAGVRTRDSRPDLDTSDCGICGRSVPATITRASGGLCGSCALNVGTP